MTYWKCLAIGMIAAASLSTFATDAMAAGTKPAPKPAVSATAPAVTGATPPPSTAGLPEDKATSNRPAEQNWLKVCDVIAAGKKAAGQRSCMLRQVIVANQQFLGSFLLRDDPSRGVVLTLHDLGMAARIAHRIVVLADGAVLADGSPDAALTPEVLARAYGVEARYHAGPGGPAFELIGRLRR